VPTITTKPLSPFKRLLSTPNEGAFKHCAIPGCVRPSQAYAGDGLNLTECRYHCQRRGRHGDYVKETYSSAQLAPYRSAALSYLKAHKGDLWIGRALTAIQNLMDGAGANERVVDTLRMKPPRKARAAFARMRVADVPPIKLLTNTLAVSLAVREDPVRPMGVFDEYRLTQIAKVALRMASGYHAHYGVNPQGKVIQYDRYPRSSGRYLRLMGKALDEACEHVVTEHLEAILSLKVQRHGGWPKG